MQQQTQHAYTYEDRLTRQEIRDAIACPECGAERTTACINVKGLRRTANHVGRIRTAYRMAAVERVLRP